MLPTGGDAWATAHLKLPDATSPLHLPPARALSSAVRGALEPGGAHLMGCSLREGCLLLSLDLMGGDPSENDSERAQRLAEALHLALRGFPSASGGVLRLRDAAVRLGGGVEPAPAPARPAAPSASVSALCVLSASAPLPQLTKAKPRG